MFRSLDVAGEGPGFAFSTVEEQLCSMEDVIAQVNLPDARRMFTTDFTISQ